MCYFPPYDHNKSKVKVELDLSNYAISLALKMQQVLVHHYFLKNVI